MSLEARKLCFNYGERPTIDGIDLRIDTGDMVAILGPNGAGKSTLLKLLCGLIAPDAGEVHIDDARLDRLAPRDLARKIALVSQDVNREVPFSVEEIVRMGRSPHTGFWGTMGKHDHQRVERAMQTTGIGHLRKHLLNEVSSGEFQRVMIALALAQDTPYLVLDEPTAFLDLKHQVQILTLLRTLNRDENKTIVTVTHDLNFAATFFGRIVLMKSGRIPAEGSVTSVLTSETIREIFDVNTRVEALAQGGAVRVTLEEA